MKWALFYSNLYKLQITNMSRIKLFENQKYKKKIILGANKKKERKKEKK